MKYIYWTMSVCFAFFACQDASDDRFKEIKAGEKDYASIIRNGASMNDRDTINVAKLQLEETVYDFGIITQKDSISHEFTFTNTGKVPLIITHAKSTCGCTVPEYNKEPVLPGKKGKLLVRFNPDKKEGIQRKPVTITANTYPSETVLYIVGEVKK